MGKQERKERKIIILESALEDMQQRYDLVLDNAIVNPTAANETAERLLFQQISQTKKKLEQLRGEEVSFSDKELDEMVTGVNEEKQELTELEKVLFDAIAERI